VGSEAQPTNDLVHTGVKECSSGGSSFCWFSWQQMCKFMSEIQFLVGRRPMRSYSSWGTVATIALRKSAPMQRAMPLKSIHLNQFIKLYLVKPARDDRSTS